MHHQLSNPNVAQFASQNPINVQDIEPQRVSHRHQEPTPKQTYSEEDEKDVVDDDDDEGPIDPKSTPIHEEVHQHHVDTKQQDWGQDDSDGEVHEADVQDEEAEDIVGGAEIDEPKGVHHPKGHDEEKHVPYRGNNRRGGYRGFRGQPYKRGARGARGTRGGFRGAHHDNQHYYEDNQERPYYQKRHYHNKGYKQEFANIVEEEPEAAAEGDWNITKTKKYNKPQRQEY